MTEYTLMDALTAITQRVSVAQLTGAEPSQVQIEKLYQAAFRAPDHGRLRPWRYLTLRDKGLIELGEVFAEAGLKKNPELNQDEIARLQRMPQRAPLMIVAIANIQEHVKIPALEQRLAVAAGVQNIITAAYAMGLGAMWRTGEMAYDSHVKASLGLGVGEEIIGFIYLGQANCKLKQAPVLTMGDFVQEWPFSN
ncbi:MAG: nitroreductase [Oleispira sp.]|nr:nitroreductase [Oleispira sp.]